MSRQRTDLTCGAHMAAALGMFHACSFVAARAETFGTRGIPSPRAMCASGAEPKRGTHTRALDAPLSKPMHSRFCQILPPTTPNPQMLHTVGQLRACPRVASTQMAPSTLKLRDPVASGASCLSRITYDSKGIRQCGSCHYPTTNNYEHATGHGGAKCENQLMPNTR